MFVPSRNYVVCHSLNGQSKTWQDSLSLISQIQTELNATSAKRIALCFDDSFHFFNALFATLGCNKQPILLPNNLTGTLISLQDQYDYVLTDSATLSCSAPSFNSRVLVEHAHPSSNDLDIDWHQTLILFTSGSTGQPKKIVKSLEQIRTEIADLTQLFGDKSKQALTVASVSHQHLYGLLFKIFWSLYEQRPFLRELLRFEEDLICDQPVVFVSSPALLKRLDDKPAVSHQIRLTFSSGGPLDTASALRFQTQYGQLPFEIFGSTETGGIAYRQQESAQTPWTPLPAVSIDADEDHRLLLKSRYEGSNQWILADDVIELLPNEQFLLKGRIDRIIKIEEKRVSLTMIERLIGEFIAPLHCKVVDFELNDRTLIGCVIQHNSHIDELSRPQLSALKQHLSEHLERIAIPKRFRYVDQFPINPQGKIEFALLRDLMLAEVCDV